MNELISLTQFAINGELQQTVNARETLLLVGSEKFLGINTGNKVG